MAKFWIKSPPKISKANKTNKVVSDVIKTEDDTKKIENKKFEELALEKN